MTQSNEAGVPSGSPWWRHYLREHPALILSGSYLFLTVVGAIYNWRLCSRFGINLLDLADGGDFLLYAVRDLAVVGWALFAILLCAGCYAWTIRLRSAPPKQRNAKESDPRQIAALWIVFAAVFLFVYLNQWAGIKARSIRAGEGRACQYALADEPKAALQSAQLVTTTSRFVVVYRTDDKTTEVIPLESLSRLVFVKPSR
jgi:hypothetical protein